MKASAGVAIVSGRSCAHGADICHFARRGQILQGLWTFDVADHGGLIVAVPVGKGFQNSVLFSWDYGSTWNRFQFQDMPIAVVKVRYSPAAAGLVWFGLVWLRRPCPVPPLHTNTPPLPFCGHCTRHVTSAGHVVVLYLWPNACGW
jgi:hypothetical protein